MLSVNLQRDLLVTNYGERNTDICTCIQHLCDNGSMPNRTLLLVMASEIKVAEIAIIEAIKQEDIKYVKRKLKAKARRATRIKVQPTDPS